MKQIIDKTITSLKTHPLELHCPVVDRIGYSGKGLALTSYKFPGGDGLLRPVTMTTIMFNLSQSYSLTKAEFLIQTLALDMRLHTLTIRNNATEKRVIV